MNDANGTNGTQRKALGRGLADILGTDYPQTESVSTARAAFEIAAILEGVEDRQVGNIFQFVRNIRQTQRTKEETVPELAEGLRRIDKERRDRDREPNKSWWKRWAW